MKIYFISLEQDIERRLELLENFPKLYSEMEWIKGINGKSLTAKDYFFHLKKYYRTHNKIMTPSEIGCTLSHIKALEEFLETKEKNCLILEDDIKGCDNFIFEIENFLKKNTFNGIWICGGQQGIGYEKYVLGKRINNITFELPNFSLKFIFRTCCYVIDRESAVKMVNYFKNEISSADDWYQLATQRKIKFFYSNFFIHPDDLMDSHIEKERSYFYELNFFKRMLKEGFFKKIFNRIRNDILKYYYLLKGYKLILKEKRNV